MKHNLKELNQRFEKDSPEAFLKWSVGEFGSDLVLASSFGAEDVALIDIALKVKPDFRIITLDTGRLPDETYEVMERIRQKYKINIATFFPQSEKIEALVNRSGFFSFRESVEKRKECCYIRKVEPLNRALKNVQGWVTGLRREQSQTRTTMQKIEIDEAHGGILKLNPLATWSEKQTWDYIRKNKVPYNHLHDKGYPSIGCAPCTRAIKKGEDVRSGRWWWENPEHKECGIHLPKKP